MDRERLVKTIHRANSVILDAYFNEASDDDLKHETHEVIIDLLKTLDYYDLKEFRITLRNMGLI